MFNKNLSGQFSKNFVNPKRLRRLKFFGKYIIDPPPPLNFQTRVHFTCSQPHFEGKNRTISEPSTNFLRTDKRLEEQTD
jgi:hypothetical protein